MAVIDWVAILAGFGSAVLASMGMGGGSILILYLTLIAGVPQREAQGVNLLFFLPIGAAALWLHWRQGRVDKTAVRQFPSHPDCWGAALGHRACHAGRTRACSAGDLPGVSAAHRIAAAFPR